MRFSTGELIKSLFCPALCIIWAVVRFVGDLTSGVPAWAIGGGCFALSCILSFFIGGVLCTILTLTLKIHTENYLKNRLITIFVVYYINSFIGLYVGVDILKFIYFMIFYIGGIIFQVLKIQTNETTNAQRAVLMLSDPLVYFTIYWVTLYSAEYVVSSYKKLN